MRNIVIKNHIDKIYDEKQVEKELGVITDRLIQLSNQNSLLDENGLHIQFAGENVLSRPEPKLDNDDKIWPCEFYSWITKVIETIPDKYKIDMKKNLKELEWIPEILKKFDKEEKEKLVIDMIKYLNKPDFNFDLLRYSAFTFHFKRAGINVEELEQKINRAYQIINNIHFMAIQTN